MVNYKEMMEDIFDMSKNMVVAEGGIDIEKYDNKIGTTSFITYNTKEVPWLWIVLGRGPEEMITECLMNSSWEVESEGHYRFKAIFKYEPAEYGDYGRMIMRDYYEICHIDLEFEETFIQRKRDEIINDIVDDGLNDFLI